MTVWDNLGLDQGEMLHRVVHQLRSPLSDAFTYANGILDDHPDLDASVQKDIVQIRNSAERTLEIADKVIELVRVSMLEPAFTLISIASPIQEARSRLQTNVADGSCTITYSLQSSLPAVVMDPSAIAQAIAILIEHVLIFSTQNLIGVTAHLDQDEIIVCVGENLDQNQLPNRQLIPLPLAHVKGGLGIDLMTCTQLIRMHNGRLWASEGTVPEAINLNLSIPLKPTLGTDC
jgi:K+-sensing histidine kinase KdpD